MGVQWTVVWAEECVVTRALVNVALGVCGRMEGCRFAILAAYGCEEGSGGEVV